jgi:hypothetical protein
MTYHVSDQTFLRSPTPSLDSHKISSFFSARAPQVSVFFLFEQLLLFPPLLPLSLLSLPHLPIHTSHSQWLSESFTVFLYVLFLIISPIDLMDYIHPAALLPLLRTAG